jgi:hypothetical protein
MTILFDVLANSVEPLHYTEITKRAIDLGLLSGASDVAVIISNIYLLLSKNPHLFEQVGTDQYCLRAGAITKLSELVFDECESGAGIEQSPAKAPVESEEHHRARMYVAPSLQEIVTAISQCGLRADERLVRRIHLALKTRGFVILQGLSGTGKTWLAETYSRSIGAAYLLVSVSPDWTTNEAFLGSTSSLQPEGAQQLSVVDFLLLAAHEYTESLEQHRPPRPYHLVLDEMNLAPAEQYLAKFLSAMEIRSRTEVAYIDLGARYTVPLYPNLFIIGTAIMDGTTYGFSDKLYDRAQLIEMPLLRETLYLAIADVPYRDLLMQVWDALSDVAPFAYRVVAEIQAYIGAAEKFEVSWEDALDEQIAQKILSKCRSTNVKMERALLQLRELLPVHTFPLSAEKIHVLLGELQLPVISSFF